MHAEGWKVAAISAGDGPGSPRAGSRPRGVREGRLSWTMAYEIPVTQARAELADLINRVVYGGERVVVTRHGKPLVALVSAADLERLDELGRARRSR